MLEQPAFVQRPRLPLRSRRSKIIRRLWLVLFPVLFCALVATGVYLINAHWPYRYRIVKPLLEGTLGSQVEIARYHRTYFPHPGFVAEQLTLRRKSAHNLDPLGSVDQLAVQGDWSDLLLLRPRVRLVDLQGLHLLIPAPGSRASQEDFPPGSATDFAGPDTLIEMLKVHRGLLEIMREGSPPLSFPVEELDVRNFEKGRALDFTVDMENAIPHGRIHSVGHFGPLNAGNLGATPVWGTFSFSSVALRDLGELHGTLSSTGRFWGRMAAIEAEADSNTPDFAVSDGTPTAVRGTVHCFVNGLNGETELERIEVWSGATTITARGNVKGVPKATHLDVLLAQGRAQDVLKPFLHTGVPIAGPVRLRAHAYLAPVEKGTGFLKRLRVDSVFAVPAERATSRPIEKSLTDFSRRATPHPEPAPKGDDGATDSTDVLSSLAGPAQIRDGVVSSSRRTFAGPGATARLAGTFRLEDQTVHLTGQLAMQTGASHAVTGFKSFLLKPLDPFLKKHNAGAVIPIAVVGTPGHYKVTQDFAHQK